MTDHQEANIWIRCSNRKEPCYTDRNKHSADTDAAGQRAYHSASTVMLNCTKRTRSHGQENHRKHGQENHCKNVVKQDPEAQTTRKRFRKPHWPGRPESNSNKSRKTVVSGSGLETRAIPRETAGSSTSQVTCTVQHSAYDRKRSFG